VFARESAARPDTSSEVTLHKLYDVLVQDRLAAVQYRTTKSLTTETIVLVISVLLFAFHWRWVRRLNGTTLAAA
jgi:hypothetical protein